MVEKPRFIDVSGRLIDLSTPKVMGILNITPDSFYSGSRISSNRDLLEKAARMLDEGADFLDIGGVSTRPGAQEITADEEGIRVLAAVREIASEFPEAILSVDTYRSEIARRAVCDCGAHMINDISGGTFDSGMYTVVRELNVPYIMMHILGTPRTMQQNPVYDDVIADILVWFSEKIVTLQTEGVKDIIIDPGFGFGKTADHNFEILNRLEEFSIAGLPLMAGLSRKSMIWKSLGTDPDNALTGTIVLNTIALMNGADILRVHDVSEAIQAVKLVEKIKKAGNKH